MRKRNVFIKELVHPSRWTIMETKIIIVITDTVTLRQLGHKPYIGWWSNNLLSTVSDNNLSSVPCWVQVVLINAVKDVAKALGNLISATKAAAGKPHDDPSMLQLKNSAKVRYKTSNQFKSVLFADTLQQ